MSNPQQPELARSRKTPHQDQDSVAGIVEGQHELGADAPRGPVPPANQPGHHPPQEQDKPDLDAFAERLGVVESPPEGAVPAPAKAAATRALGGVGEKGAVARMAAIVAAVLVVVGVVIGAKRRGARRSR